MLAAEAAVDTQAAQVYHQLLYARCLGANQELDPAGIMDATDIMLLFDGQEKRGGMAKAVQ
eukprot:3213298-Rhodomonas_salina.1